MRHGHNFKIFIQETKNIKVTSVAQAEYTRQFKSYV